MRNIYLSASDNNVFFIRNKTEMEVQLSGATEGGERKNEAQCLYDVLSRKSRVPSFLENAGIVHQKPSRSFSSTLAAELEIGRAHV